MNHRPTLACCASIALAIVPMIALTACKSANPSPTSSAESRNQLRDEAKWDLDKARTELSELNAVIAAVTDKGKRSEFEDRADDFGDRIEHAAGRITAYQKKSDTEGVASVLMSELADVRAEIERLRAVVAGGNY